MVNLNTNKSDSTFYLNVVHRNHNHLSNNSSNDCDKSNDFTIFYQNVRGIYKIDELLISLIPNTPPSSLPDRTPPMDWWNKTGKPWSVYLGSSFLQTNS
jgi:hypothetical protein